VRTPQQKSGQSKEHRYGEVESAERPPDRAGLRFTGLERDMGDEDAERGQSTHTVQSRNKAPSLWRDRLRGIRGTDHHG